jgi:hypothetical protein
MSAKSRANKRPEQRVNVPFYTRIASHHARVTKADRAAEIAPGIQIYPRQRFIYCKAAPPPAPVQLTPDEVKTLAGRK